MIFQQLRTVSGGNMVCWKAMAQKRTVDDSMTYWFPWKHPMARLRGSGSWV